MPKASLLFHCRPLLTCGALQSLLWQSVVLLSVTTLRLKCTLANLFTSGKVAWGKIASGGKCTQLLMLSVSIMRDLKLMYLVYNSVEKKKIQLLHCLSSENIYQKGLNNICVNQNCQCAGMIFVRVSAMACKCWAAALKWGFCAISLWAIKCQLFIPLLLGRRHEQMCGGRWIDSDRRNFSARFSHIMHTGR